MTDKPRVCRVCHRRLKDHTDYELRECVATQEQRDWLRVLENEAANERRRLENLLESHDGER